MGRLSSLAAVLAVLSLAPSAEAQDPVRLLLLSDPTQPEEWHEALGVELVARGGELLSGDPPTGPTPLARDAYAQSEARAREADGAIWIEEESRLRLVEAEGRAARSAPIPSGADARTIAIVAASLLDEGEWVVPPPRPPNLAHALSVPPRASDEASPRPHPWVVTTHSSESTAIPATASESGFYGDLGTGGLALADDGGFDPGSVLRAALGHRFNPWFRLGALVEGGFISERLAESELGSGLELQPWGRLCAEPTFDFSLGRIALHLGAHACGFATELRFFVFIEPGFPVPPARTQDLALGLSAGGFFGVSIELSPSVSLWIRADLDGAVFAAPRAATTISGLSTMVSFR